MPGSDELVAVAVDDLAARFGFDADDITVVSVEEVTWPDAGLGCRATGETYEPVPVPGYRIVLAHGTLQYRYHGADGGRGPFLCQFLD